LFKGYAYQAKRFHRELTVRLRRLTGVDNFIVMGMSFDLRYAKGFDQNALSVEIDANEKL
jgi:hypothetical protein